MKRRFIFCIISVVLLFALMPSFSAGAAGKIQKITVLGDSISSGYGLDENEKTYGAWLGEYFGADVENYAVTGQTTYELLELLDMEDAIADSLGRADLICISVGGNDVMEIFFKDLKAIRDSISLDSVKKNGGFSFTPESIQNIILSLSSEMGPASAEAGKNIGEISRKIAEINPRAEVVFQTVYNPFETDEQSLQQYFTPLHSFTSIYLSAINNAVKNVENAWIADINKKFSGYCTKLTNINSMDIHPNSLGHQVIAEEIVQLLRTPGEYSVFSSISADTELPAELINEVQQLEQGEFRPEPKAAPVTEPQPTKAVIEEITAAKEVKTEKTETDNDKKISIVWLIAGVILILTVTTVYIILKRKRKDNI